LYFGGLTPTQTIELTSEVAQRLKDLDGSDFTGFSHVIKASEVRHILRHHGDYGTEIPRGQLPVTLRSFSYLPDALNNPDVIQYAYREPDGSPC